MGFDSQFMFDKSDDDGMDDDDEIEEDSSREVSRVEMSPDL